MVDRTALATTDEGKCVLQFCFATARLLRPILRNPVARKNLAVEVGGGAAYNPHYQIDLLPGALAEITWKHSTGNDRTLLYLEERGFMTLGRTRKERYVIIDPLDESSAVGTGLRVQVSGAVVCDERGEFLAGGIASLQDFIIYLKGQPIKEATIWYNMAREAGCIVTYPDGRPIGLPSLVLAAVRGRNMETRIPAVISRTPEIHHQVVPIAQIPTASFGAA